MFEVTQRDDGMWEYRVKTAEGLAAVSQSSECSFLAGMYFLETRGFNLIAYSAPLTPEEMLASTRTIQEKLADPMSLLSWHFDETDFAELAKRGIVALTPPHLFAGTHFEERLYSKCQRCEHPIVHGACAGHSGG